MFINEVCVGISGVEEQLTHISHTRCLPFADDRTIELHGVNNASEMGCSS